MAVVQISRIQIRRGKANAGTGIPQLASGELAWAVDTQELYIGSGSVAEGAPAVDNIKVITELDLAVNNNILNLLQYVYKVSDPGMQTGDTANTPVSRSIQTRLDDQISAADFGANGDGALTDDTVALQRAIDQLFLNTTRTKASDPSVDGIKNRVILNIPAGVYNVSSTLYIPSYSALVGEGADCTIINFTGTGPAIQFVNDSSVPGTPSPLSNTGSTDNPRFILIKGLTIQTNDDTQSCLVLDAVTNSVFESISLKGVIANPSSTDNIGIVINAKSHLITSEHNLFRDITIDGFSYAVWSDSDISHNTFRDVYISNCHTGYSLGKTVGAGQLYGPRRTLIVNNDFEYIDEYAVFVGGVNDGSTQMNNSIKDCRLVNVGNDQGNNAQPLYPQIYFRSIGNHIDNVKSDRTDALSGTAYTDVQYMPEVAGHVVYKSASTREVSLTTVNGYQGIAFRLPVSTDEQGNSVKSISYTIDYVYRVDTPGDIGNPSGWHYSRRGTLKVNADLDASISLNAPYVQLSDEYEFTGYDPQGTYATDLDFRAVLTNIDSTPFVDSLGYPVTLQINYASTIAGGTLVYSYVATS
jgi:hypothetical protein